MTELPSARSHSGVTCRRMSAPARFPNKAEGLPPLRLAQTPLVRPCCLFLLCACSRARRSGVIILGELKLSGSPSSLTHQRLLKKRLSTRYGYLTDMTPGGGSITRAAIPGNRSRYSFPTMSGSASLAIVILISMLDYAFPHRSVPEVPALDQAATLVQATRLIGSMSLIRNEPNRATDTNQDR